MINYLLNLLFPSGCPSCNSIPDRLRFSPLCSRCWGSITSVSDTPRCEVCGVSLASGYPTVCISCIKERPFYERVYVHGDYDGVLKKAINCMKFNRVRRLGIPLGELLCSVSLPEVDAVVPVPLSKERIVSRGFNQAHLLALSLSRKLKIPFRSDILVKIRNTVPQSLLSRKERLRSPAGAFSINRNIKKGLPHRILIVDDVMTTGATMNECARVLRVAGVRVVYGVVLARACSD